MGWVVMTHNISPVAGALTALAAALAFSSTSFAAQETAPPEVDTSVETPATSDPLAPEPTSADQAVPPAPQPKVETTTTTTATPRTERATRTATRAPTRAAPRRTAAAAPVAASPTPVAETAAPAPLPAEQSPPVTTAPPAAPVAEPAPAPTADTSISDLTSEDNLPILGAAALVLLALGGAAFFASRRKRRREDEEFAARQQALAMIEEEPALELGSADEVQPAPAFARAPAPKHDPVPATRIRSKIPARGNWETPPDTHFMLSPAEKPKTPVDKG